MNRNARLKESTQMKLSESIHNTPVLRCDDSLLESWTNDALELETENAKLRAALAEVRDVCASYSPHNTHALGPMAAGILDILKKHGVQ